MPQIESMQTGTPIPRSRDLYWFAREERLFCGILAHLLMQRGPNLAGFLELINAGLPEDCRLGTAALDEAQVYVEFTLLRDHWNALGRDNTRKRELIVDLLSRMDTLKRYHNRDFPATVPKFNEFFMGARGKRIKDDISYPGQWSVVALFQRFGRQPDEFRDICRFKWAFNIKPDIVVLMPDARPVSIEAKLESPEGQYPRAGEECRIFDGLFGLRKGRVSQIELQQFMFGVLLGEPCHSVVIRRTLERSKDVVALTWTDVFERLNVTSSIGFVSRLIQGNEHLKARTPNAGLSPSAIRR